MILIGHRGCSYPGYNQNTLRAFEKVSLEGVPAIEFDVQISADQELVIVHNLDLEEVSNGSGKVSETNGDELKKLWAGDPAKGEDRIPFLEEVLDFFASLPEEKRPGIHLELKGDGTGIPAGRLVKKYLKDGKLILDDFLISSFNWAELRNIRSLCPTIAIALLDGAIRRNQLLDKTGSEADKLFEKIFAYGCEQYMLPRFATLQENRSLVDAECSDKRISELLTQEIEICLRGGYYNDELLNTAVEMKASSVNLWFRNVTPEFITKAHARGLKIFVYTVNKVEELLEVAQMGVDGIFTDYYKESSALLSPYLSS